VSNERECNVSVRQWTAHDEMIVAMHQNTDHATSYLEARIGNRITDREMVHHLSLLGRQVEIIVHLVIVKRADASRPESERLRGEIQAVTDGACFKMHIAITTVSIGADGTLDIADHPAVMGQDFQFVYDNGGFTCGISGSTCTYRKGRLAIAKMDGAAGVLRVARRSVSMR